jgi:carboxypeptidase C (cathepsin A)
MKRPVVVLLVAAFSAAAFMPSTSVYASPQEPPEKSAAADKDKEREKEKEKEPEERTSRTRHSVTIDGRTLPFTATAGTMVLKDEAGKAKASVFYVAYVREDVKDAAARPVTYSFNGGPGAAALWVHMGAFGPKVVERDPEGMGLAPPGRLIDNRYSILDLTDLVFIDPVSTGFSRPAPGEDAKQFHGLEEDIQWVGEFIRLWTTRNGRWASPKFVAGESYGTTRAAGLADYLQDRFGMELNGVVLISSVLNFQNQELDVGNDIGYVIHLPSYAATAWYHKKLAPELSGDLRALLDEVERFARGEYASALLEGDRLPPARRREIAERVARYTGLTPEYVERTNLRIDIFRFTKELLRTEGKTVGRIDSRFTGRDLDAAGESFEFDPSLTSVDGPYVAAFNDFLRRELKFEIDLVYERLARVWPWSYRGFQNRYVNVAERLRQAMTRNPHLEVLMASGYYDLATPYFDSVYTAEHLGLPPELRGNLRVAFYESGHMMYIRAADHAKFKQDLAAFYRDALAAGAARAGQRAGG